MLLWSHAQQRTPCGVPGRRQPQGATARGCCTAVPKPAPPHLQGSRLELGAFGPHCGLLQLYTQQLQLCRGQKKGEGAAGEGTAGEGEQACRSPRAARSMQQLPWAPLLLPRVADPGNPCHRSAFFCSREAAPAAGGGMGCGALMPAERVRDAVLPSTHLPRGPQPPPPKCSQRRPHAPPSVGQRQQGQREQRSGPHAPTELPSRQGRLFFLSTYAHACMRRVLLGSMRQCPGIPVSAREQM